jgi:hypothetical protein
LHDRSQPKPPKKPRASKSAKPVRGGTRGQGTRRGRNRKPDTPDHEGTEEEQAEPTQHQDDVAAAASSDIGAPKSRKTKKGSTVDPTEIQILGLCNNEPIISYGGNIYSCQWTASIGSNLLFKKHYGHVEPSHQPLETLGSWDLIGLGAATLVASPATIQPRRRGTLDLRHENGNPTPGSGVRSIRLKDDSTQQDLFLKQFADIKRWKGEANQHTLTTLQGKTTADGKPIAPIRGRGRGNRRPHVVVSSPRGPGPITRSTSATPPVSDQDDQAQATSIPISTPTPNTWSTFESPAVHRAPPPVFTGFPEYNLREDMASNVVEESPGPSLAELLRNAAHGNQGN